MFYLADKSRTYSQVNRQSSHTPTDSCYAQTLCMLKNDVWLQVMHKMHLSVVCVILYDGMILVQKGKKRITVFVFYIMQHLYAVA